jgi:hypothetical protein
MSSNMKSLVLIIKKILFLCQRQSFDGKIRPSGGVDVELSELYMRLSESQAINEELKRTFKKNLTMLEQTLHECVDDKEKLIEKK